MFKWTFIFLIVVSNSIATAEEEGYCEPDASNKIDASCFEKLRLNESPKEQKKTTPGLTILDHHKECLKHTTTPPIIQCYASKIDTGAMTEHQGLSAIIKYTSQKNTEDAYYSGTIYKKGKRWGVQISKANWDISEVSYGYDLDARTWLFNDVKNYDFADITATTIMYAMDTDLSAISEFEYSLIRNPPIGSGFEKQVYKITNPQVSGLKEDCSRVKEILKTIPKNEAGYMILVTGYRCQEEVEGYYTGIYKGKVEEGILKSIGFETKNITKGSLDQDFQ